MTINDGLFEHQRVSFAPPPLPQSICPGCKLDPNNGCTCNGGTRASCAFCNRPLHNQAAIQNHTCTEDEEQYEACDDCGVERLNCECYDLCDGGCGYNVIDCDCY